MKFIKKHINAIVGLGVILLAIIGLLILKDIFYPTENKAIYGIKNYYDIQFIIENDTNTAEFPIIGYKHHTKPEISWTKDRTVG